MTQRALAFQGVFLLLGLAAYLIDCHADTTYYRRELQDRFPGTRFVEEVPARSGGNYYRIERDNAGRITRETWFRNGAPTGSEYIYSFEGNAELPSGYRYFEAGEEKGRTHYTRDTRGNVIRAESYTVGGTLSSYSTLQYLSDELTVIHGFAPDGKEISRGESHYSSAGILIRSRSYNVPDLSSYVDRVYDVGTGRVTSATQFTGGKVSVRSSYAFNADGDVVREDAYDADGSFFASEEFSDDLAIRRRYSDGKELRYTWDAHRRRVGTEVWFGGRLICRLTYDRLPNYIVTRTIAVGPNGDLWAEYPNKQVIDIDEDGMPSQGGETKILKTGKWW